MAQEFRISVDLASLLEVGPIARAGIFGNLSGAVEAVAVAGVERWRQAVGVQRLWQGEKQAYQASIRYQMTGPYSAVIESDYKYVEDIETGRPAYDLKKMLSTSPKVRRTKDGRRFLVIPIRTNLASMSAPAQAMASDLSASSIASQSQRPAGEVTTMSPKGGMRAAGRRAQTPFLSNTTGGKYMVRKNEYAWGGKLSRKMLAAGGASATEQKRLAGLHRFDTSSGKSKSSAFMSFRIMMEGSSGWIVPARPGLWLARTVSQSLQRTANTDFSAAMQMDLIAA
jgi:hypothetical protein